MNGEENNYIFKSLQIMGGDNVLTVAAVTLKNGQGEVRDASAGNKPTDAILNCISRIIGYSAESVDFRVHNTDTLVQIRLNNSIYKGSGISPDVLEASALAYVNAFNKFLSEHPAVVAEK